MLYFAYGSNLNIEHMKWRCPAAKPLSKLMLKDARLVFRGVADCIYEEGSVCPGGIWKITPACERALDRYEGFRPEDPEHGSYRKEFCKFDEPFEGEEELMFYAMNSEGIYPPSQGYLDTIIEGYEDFRLPKKYLKDAVRRSWKDSNPSHIERRRWRKNGGRPQHLGLSKTVTERKCG